MHNVFGARGNQTIASDFLFRHFRGVTTNWNYTRWTDDVLDRSRLVRDEALAAEIARAGIGHIHA